MSRRVAFVTTHPIQYQAPIFRLLAERPEVDLTVLFCQIPDQAMQELRQVGPAADMVFLNIHDVLHVVLDAFYENDLLEEFVVGPGSNMPVFTRPRA